MKAKKPGRILSLLLSAVMLLALLPATAFATGGATPAPMAALPEITRTIKSGETVNYGDIQVGWAFEPGAKITDRTKTLYFFRYEALAANFTGVAIAGVKSTDEEGAAHTVAASYPHGNPAYDDGKPITTRSVWVVAEITAASMPRMVCPYPTLTTQYTVTVAKDGLKDATAAFEILWDGNSIPTTGDSFKIANSDKLKVTITPSSSNSFQTPPTVSATNATVAAVTKVAGKEEYTCEMIGFTGNSTITVNGTATAGPPPAPTFDVVYDVAGGAGSGSRLEGSLNAVVTDPAGGVTAADKAAGNSVSLKLTVAEKTAASTPDSDKVEGVKQGDSVQYYEVKVEKTVTPAGGNPITTTLTGIPKPVRAMIPIPADMQGKTSYTVYRVHNGAAEKIPNDPTAPEFYAVNEGGTSLTLHVKNFSTYAVVTGDKALSGDHTFGDAANPKSSAVDVQGKILEGVFGVYKLDVSWGAMKFDYNAQGKVWNPDTHSYIPGSGAKDWTAESFIDPNNKITVANHSNGDVTLSYFAKPDAVLAGATMTVRSANSLASIEAANLVLPKVPTETAAAPTVDTFVWLTGEPTQLTGSKSYAKAGVITITAEADTTSGLTPKNP